MRISTAQSFEAGIGNLQRAQSALAESQQRMTSQKRVSKASDDPAAAARAERATAAIVRSQTSQRAVDASRSAMTQTESALADAGSLVQQARDTLVAAGNGTYSDVERKHLANQIAQIRTQLLAVANRTDGAGSYLFAGQGSSQAPFLDAPGGVRFVGTAGDAKTEASTGLPLAVDGGALFLSARTGNGVFATHAATGVTQARIDGGSVVDPAALTGSSYSLQFSVAGGNTTYAILKDGAATAVTAAPYVSGQAIRVDGMAVAVTGAPAAGDRFDIVPSTPDLSVFDVLDRAAAALAMPGRSNSQIAQVNGQALRDIDASLGTLQAARGVAGQVLARIEGETARLADLELNGRTERAQAEDLDLVAAVSEFQTRQTSYDAALKSYAMVQRLSLFDHLG
ncbi:MAG: flagellar hook-associated protein FlgL [Burkholderiaceae bacterium]